MAATQTQAPGPPSSELEFLERGLAMRHQQTVEWFTIELAIPMILAVALLLALIVELALRIE
jgi:hypothetical protein